MRRYLCWKGSKRLSLGLVWVLTPWFFSPLYPCWYTFFSHSSKSRSIGPGLTSMILRMHAAAILPITPCGNQKLCLVHFFPNWGISLLLSFSSWFLFMFTSPNWKLSPPSESLFSLSFLLFLVLEGF